MDFQSTALPTELYSHIVEIVGSEPTSLDFQSSAFTRLALSPYFFGYLIGFEPTLREPQSLVLTTNTIDTILIIRVLYKTRTCNFLFQGSGVTTQLDTNYQLITPYFSGGCGVRTHAAFTPYQFSKLTSSPIWVNLHFIYAEDRDYDSHTSQSTYCFRNSAWNQSKFIFHNK